MSANVLGTVVDTVKVEINNLIPLAIVLSVNQRTSSPGNTSIGNKNVNLAKLLDLLLDGSLNSGTVIDSNLVGLSLNTVLFRKRLGLCIGIVRVVPNGDVGTSLGKGLSDTVANSGGRASDRSNLSLEGEKIQNVVGRLGGRLGKGTQTSKVSLSFNGHYERGR